MSPLSASKVIFSTWTLLSTALLLRSESEATHTDPETARFSELTPNLLTLRNACITNEMQIYLPNADVGKKISLLEGRHLRKLHITSPRVHLPHVFSASCASANSSYDDLGCEPVFEPLNKSNLLWMVLPDMLDLWEFMPNFIGVLKAMQLLGWRPNSTQLLVYGINDDSVNFPEHKSQKHIRLLDMLSESDWSRGETIDADKCFCFGTVAVLDRVFDQNVTKHDYELFREQIRSFLNIHETSELLQNDMISDDIKFFVQNETSVKVLLLQRKYTRILLDIQQIKHEIETNRNIKQKIRQMDGKTGIEVRIDEFEERTLEEQILYMTSVDIVVAAHGAALTWTHFLKPRAMLIELFPPNDEQCNELTREEEKATNLTFPFNHDYSNYAWVVCKKRKNYHFCFKSCSDPGNSNWRWDQVEFSKSEIKNIFNSVAPYISEELDPDFICYP